MALFYHIDIFLSIVSDDFTVCLFGCGAPRFAFPSKLAQAVPFLLKRFALSHACCLPCDKQDGLRHLAFLFRRVEIAIRAFSRCRCGYLPLWVHFGLVRFFMAISTGYRGRWGRRTENGAGGAAFVRFCASTLALQCFPRGVRWGCAPQTCAKESSTLWTLFTLRRGYAGADSRRLCVFAQLHWL